MRSYNRKNIILKLISAFAVFTIMVSAFSLNILYANGEQNSNPTADFFTQQSQLEFKNLSSPTDVFYSENTVAITENQSIKIFKDGEFLQTDSLSFTTLKQVKNLDTDNLLVLDNAIIYSINLSTMQKIELKDSENHLISGNYFDFNGQYLVTAFGTSALVYRYDNGSFIKQNVAFSVKVDLPICINDNNEILFVDDDGIFKINVPNTADRKCLSSDYPDKMIVDNEFVYYVLGAKIYRQSLSGNNKEELSFSNLDDKFSLGKKINSPRVISFKGNNLLISDTDTVQEFNIDGNILTFTGFAVADGKTAYNRISKDATDVEKYGDYTAILDSDKLTVIKNNPADIYARDNYKNFFKEDFNGEMPDSIALGKGTLLLCFNTGTSNSYLKLLNLIDGSFSEQKTIEQSNVSRDIAYQSGYYYVLCDNGSAPSKVYSINENDFSLSQSILTSQILMNKIAVDVFGNVFLSNGSDVYKFVKSQNYTPSAPICYSSNIYKMSTDLSGGLYLLCDNGLNVFDGTNLIPLNVDTNGTKIKSFAMDFIDDNVYFIVNDKEAVFISTDLQNISIASIAIPTDFITTGPNADVNQLKIYQPIDGANVYSIETNGQNFQHSQLINRLEEYVFICEISLSNGVNSVNLYALAGQNHTVLINQEEVIEVTPTLSDSPTVAFTTTGVNMYYLPLITKNGEYSLTNNQPVRLEKATEINPTKQFTYLDKDYYFASATVGQNTYFGYIPVAFTVEVLSEDFKWDEYVIEKVNKTTVYADDNLTAELLSLEDGDAVRVIKQLDDKYLISVKTVDGWVNGYVDINAIKNQPRTAIRNALLILVVSACVCATTIFFVLKRKD